MTLFNIKKFIKHCFDCPRWVSDRSVSSETVIYEAFVLIGEIVIEKLGRMKWTCVHFSFSPFKQCHRGLAPLDSYPENYLHGDISS